jgi:ribonuclease HII
MKYTIGIDEAGKGPLAGPVSVGVFAIETKKLNTLKRKFSGFKDSKKLSSSKREEIFSLISKEFKDGECFYSVSMVGSDLIDSQGIVSCINKAMNMSLNRLSRHGITPENSQVYLDGSLKAPKNFIHQKTVIRGDDLIPVISLASICAKVIRDKEMISLSKKFPKYCFDIHKGYGTKLHYEKIKKYGPCQIHRTTFLS